MENTLNHTITEDYVSFETARLLKKKGFSEECNTYFASDDEIAAIPIIRDFNNHGIYLSAPTLQMAMKWLRTKGIVIVIKYDAVPNNLAFGDFYWVVYRLHWEINPRSDNSFETYEEALDDAIRYCMRQFF